MDHLPWKWLSGGQDLHLEGWVLFLAADDPLSDS